MERRPSSGSVSPSTPPTAGTHTNLPPPAGNPGHARRISVDRPAPNRTLPRLPQNANTSAMRPPLLGTPQVNKGFAASSGAAKGKWSSSSLSDSSKRLLRELDGMSAHQHDAKFNAGPKGSSVFEWVAVIHGPSRSPYHGGLFFVDIHFPPDYPFQPPRLRFRTRIFHCNIDSSGNVALSVLSESWSPAYTISRVLGDIWSLLKVPDLAHAIVPSIAQLYTQDPQEFVEIARQWTIRFAT
mmetsp:Transcript_10752/g.19444  ORF Transcript_10752/g.19444 Transcript_10752/m.19444 type:complete len:240 (-) Transcript_10752:2084-2803(-)